MGFHELILHNVIGKSVEISAPNKVEGLVSLDKFWQFNDSILEIDARAIDTSALTTLLKTFNECHKVKYINVTGWDTSNVIVMDQLFRVCYDLESIDGLDAFDTSSVETMSYMYRHCNKLGQDTFEKMAEWNVQNVKRLWQTFIYCYLLVNVDFMSNWQTSSLETLEDCFYDCKALVNTHGIANWDVSKVTNTAYTFGGCSDLTVVNLSGWNLASLTTKNNMFDGSNAITHLYARTTGDADKLRTGTGLKSGVPIYIGPPESAVFYRNS